MFYELHPIRLNFLLVGDTVFSEYCASLLIVNYTEILKQVTSDKMLRCYTYAIHTHHKYVTMKLINRKAISSKSYRL